MEIKIKAKQKSNLTKINMRVAGINIVSRSYFIRDTDCVES